MSFSFVNYKSHVEDGDTAIVYMSQIKKEALQMKKGSVLNTKFGQIPHSYLIGQKYGTKVHYKKCWLYLLNATPELWTTTLPHRTQILYTADISMVLLQLNLKPGSIVVESGTGSGSMSHAIMRTIAPTGHLYTFEFHEQRAKIAKEEFVRHGFGNIVTVAHKNVLLNGFGLSNVADAVFLDLPSPWQAIAASKDALKTSGGHICSFSPCIEQVQQTCVVLEEHGFKDIRTMECLQRKHDVKTFKIQEPNFGKIENEENCGAEEPCMKLLKQEVDENNDQDKEVETVDKRTPVAMSMRSERTIDLVAARPIKQMPGHTGYLTFAVLYP